LPGSLDKTSGTGFIRAKTLASLTTDTNQEGAINQRLGLFPRILRETILILIISFAAGLVFNWFRPDRLSLVSDWTVEGQLKARFGEKAVISFEEARTVFLDEEARLMHDPDHSGTEERFLLLGMSRKLRLLLICHCYRESEELIRIISARKASKQESHQYGG
jgi:uncharacterized DUF497 family protein